MAKRRGDDEEHPNPHNHNHDTTGRSGEQPTISPRTVHKTDRLMPVDAQARQARELQEAWEARQRETRLARAFAQSIRARADARREEVRRAIWSAPDTDILVSLIWPRPTPQPVPRRPTGQLSDPAILLTTHPQGPDQRFHRYERVYYAVAGQTMLGRVEGWRRWSTGYKYLIRRQVQRTDPHLGKMLAWAEWTEEVWQDYLTSDEARVRPVARRRTRTMPLLPPPSTPSTP